MKSVQTNRRFWIGNVFASLLNSFEASNETYYQNNFSLNADL